MKRIVAERDRDIDFSRGKRGPVIKPEPGKTKISIWFDNAVLERFRNVVRKAGGGSYQTAINEALRRAMESSEGHVEEALRRVLREEVQGYRVRPKGGRTRR